MTDRRGFLRLAAGAGGASLLAACRPILLDVSRLNDWVGEKVLFFAASSGTAVRSLRADRAPAELLHFAHDPDAQGSRGVATAYRRIGPRPQELSLDDLRAMPRTSYTVKHHCVEGWSAIATWHGVPVSAVAERCEMLPGARYVRFDSFDSGYSNGWDLASAMHPQTILAYGMNDNPLPVAHGAPLRLYSPTKLGYKMTKYLVSMTFTADRPGGYWEDQGIRGLGACDRTSSRE